MVVRRNSDTSSTDLIRNCEENWERWVLRNHVIRDGIWAGTQSTAATKDLSKKLWGKLTEIGVEKSCPQRWCSRNNSVISSKGSKKVYARKIHNSKKYKTKLTKRQDKNLPSNCRVLSVSFFFFFFFMKMMPKLMCFSLNRLLGVCLWRDLYKPVVSFFCLRQRRFDSENSFRI